MNKNASEATLKRKKSFGEYYAKYGTFVILIAVFVAGIFLSKNFLTVTNIMNVIRQNSYLIILGFGATFVLAVGGLNIAYDKLIPLIGCLSCVLFINTGNLFISIILSLILGAAMGYIYGILCTVCRLQPFIVGLAITSICEGIVMIVTNGRAINGVMNTVYTVIGQGYIGSIPIPVIIMAAVMVFTLFVLKLTTFGRHAMAVGGNKKAAIVAGVRANRVIRIVYVIDGVLCAIAAIVFMSRLGSGQPNPGGGMAFDAITGVVIGGASLNGGSGGAFGSFLGCMIIGILSNIMNLLGLSTFLQSIIKGVLILVAVFIDIMTKDALANASKK